MQYAVFALWLVYGALLWRNSARVFGNLKKIPRGRRTALGSLLLFGSAVLLLLVMYGLYQTSPKGISPLGWFIITLTGTGFIHAQVLSAGLFMSMAVTEPDSDTSEPNEDTPL